VHVDDLDKVTKALQQRCEGVAVSSFRQDTRLRVPQSCVYEALQFLQQECGFDMLVDVTCVDYLHYRDAVDRFGLVYLLCNTDENVRLTVRVMLNEPDLTVPSVTPLWEGANWLEREVFDMFGIHFEGHPDLRRILMPPEFTAHPLRKDYPLQGRGERHNFTPLTREEG
jgi:NADH-quinone oxidoreductase subunit C